ncbi:MAG TPA: hypothetical protein PKZ24_04120, partial [Nitrospirales bacterium]|nr:hypothetical protein [Nitrospirales bacterium]
MSPYSSTVMSLGRLRAHQSSEGGASPPANISLMVCERESNYLGQSGRMNIRNITGALASLYELKHLREQSECHAQGE